MHPYLLLLGWSRASPRPVQGDSGSGGRRVGSDRELLLLLGHVGQAGISGYFTHGAFLPAAQKGLKGLLGLLVEPDHAQAAPSCQNYG